MKVDVILGLQWGDEGKGKIVDVLTPGYDIIARFQGGPNAGHTIEFNHKKFILHTIPSGIFYPEKTNLVGNGVILDPFIFLREINNLAGHGIDATANMVISKRTHLILPTHRLLDAAQETLKGAAKIGSTLKGIGPAYTDKIARNGLRAGDLLSPGFDNAYQHLREAHLRYIKFLGYEADSFTIDKLSFDEYERQWLEAARFMAGLRLIDSEYFIHKSLAEGKKVLAEGAQGTMLDIDFGSYPFVTSSNTSIGGVCSGLGVNPANIGEVIGVFKAYCTRVGSGPFPTEQFGEEGSRMRDTGHEYGSTTGRPRRCGWLDMVALNYSIMINGVTRLFMMKTDVLDDFPVLKAGTGYRFSNSIADQVPFDMVNDAMEVVYEDFAGWNSPLLDLDTYQKLPEALKKYVKFIEDRTKVPVIGLSYGPDRNQTLFF
ncbi:MAG: adenylosuccinate synthase [Bacteroidales bacterium]|jgi:adenylosuccinate synthase|nr:adenylosuccinate synthase [Bacteroidales bacterium]